MTVLAKLSTESAMTRRARAKPAARLGSLVAVLTLILAVAGCGASSPAAPAASLGSQIDRPLDPAVLNVPLATSTGATTTLAAYHGKTVVIGDFLTLCQEICPMTSVNFEHMGAAATRDGDGGSVVFLEVTVDPTRDTPARLAAYRTLFPDATPDWVLAGGTPAHLATLWNDLGVYYQQVPESDSPVPTDWLTGKPLTFDVDHQDAVVFIDPNGHERFLVLGNPNTAGAQPPTTLKKFLSGDGEQNLDDPGPLSWTPAQGLSVVSWLSGRQIAG